MKQLTSESIRQQPSVSRRQFIKTVSVGASGFGLGLSLPACSSITSSNDSVEGAWQPNAWLRFDASGRVVFTLDRVEMGQGTYTGFATLLAEELEIAPEQIQVVFAGVDKVYRNARIGIQATGESNSLAINWEPLRRLGASARQMFVAAASQTLQVPEASLKAEQAKVVHAASGRTLEYRELIKLAAKQTVPEQPELKSPKDYRYIGKPSQRLDSSAKVLGQATFGIDVQHENMRYAVVRRSPYIGGRLLDYQRDGLAPGVQVIEIESGVALVADSYYLARTAADALDVRWQKDDSTPESNQAIFDYYAQEADKQPGELVREQGDVEAALQAEPEGKVLEFEYRAPFLAHATMEPMNCVAHVREGRADIWTGTQAPDVARVAVAKVTEVSLSDVHVHGQFLGGGFGRRLTQDFVAEAAEISEKSGHPIKLVWSREDDMQNDWYRPASLHRLKASLDDAGNIKAWQHQVVCPEIFDWYVWDAAPALYPSAPKFMYGMLARTGLLTEGGALTPKDRSAFEGADSLPYDCEHIAVRHVKADAGVPISYWRSVGHSHNAFVTEAFMDELAHAAGQDSYQFKRDKLASSPRLKAVLDLAAQKGNWGKPDSAKRFQGIAAHKSFHSYVAQMVELELENQQIKVKKVVCAVDCGVVVNPDIVRMQMESGIVFALTAALYGDIQIQDGAVLQSNFHDYQMLRMNESPEIEVHIVDSQEAPSGVGEPGVPPLAPALAGALFKATGKRFRSTPFSLA